jgi:hypothetical protein
MRLSSAASLAKESLLNVYRSVCRTVLVAVAAAAALGTTGCPAEEKHDKKEATNATAVPVPAPTPAPTAAATAAPTATTEAAVADAPAPVPPADKVEVEGKAPSAHHTWVHGYWHWDGHAYAWQPGAWEDETAFATTAPPALRVERPGVAPGAGYSFLPGYWHYTGKEYAWAPGHWSLARAGYAYTHPTYQNVGGHYVRQGFGWEKEDATWKKRYGTGWEKQGEVYVHKTEVTEFVKRGEKEGWARKH